MLAFVTNHGYLDNVTFRGMRQSLMQSFDDIYLLDLHGNSKKKENAPDGGKDENVFDIQQGVAIGLFVKRGKVQGKPAHVYHADLYGSRASKYATLAEQDITTTPWHTLQPHSPAYLFAQQDALLLSEYELGFKLQEIFRTSSSCLNSLRDDFLVDFDQQELEGRLNDFCNAGINDEQIKLKYALTDSRDWQLSSRRKMACELGADEITKSIQRCLYRPFDFRFIQMSDALIGYPRWETTFHFLAGNNIGLVVNRQNRETVSALVSSKILGQHKIVDTFDRSYVFPLYLYPHEKQDLLDDAPQEKHINFSEEFLATLKVKVGDLSLTPEDVFAYLYAVLYAPGYRTRYAEFLKRDFPRLPLTRDVKLFRALCALGAAS